MSELANVTSSEELATLDSVSIEFGGQVALDSVSLSFRTGTSVAVIGPNGSGKSTLLNVLAGLIDVSRGTVQVADPNVALVMQSTEVDATLPISVAETVRMGRYRHCGLHRRLRSVDHRIVRDAMMQTRVDELADRQLHTLSGGQRQRVLIAQGLAQTAPLLLLDEPMSGLDLVSQEVILKVMETQVASGVGVVMTTHSLLEAARCDSVVLLAGRVVASGKPDLVINDEQLGQAFGGNVTRLPSGKLILDEAHHH